MPTLHPCPTLIAAASDAARLACPAPVQADAPDAALSVAGRCRFREVFEHAGDPTTAAATSRRRLRDLEAAGAVVHEPTPQLFVYRQARGTARTMGVVGTWSASEIGLPGTDSPIRIPERESASIERECAFLDGVGAHLEPTVSALPDEVDLDLLLRRDINERPRLHFVGPDGATHTVWRVLDPTILLDAIAQAGVITIVANAQAACVARRLGTDADGETARILTMLLPERALGAAPVELIVDDVDLDDLAPLLEAAPHEVDPAADPPTDGFASIWHATGEDRGRHALAIALRLPEHDLAHDLLHVERALDRHGVRTRPCNPPHGEATDGRACRASSADCVRIRLAHLSVAHLRRAVAMTSMTDGGGLPPGCCWLPPLPLFGLFIHPFRWNAPLPVAAAQPTP